LNNLFNLKTKSARLNRLNKAVNPAVGFLHAGRTATKRKLFYGTGPVDSQVLLDFMMSL